MIFHATETFDLQHPGSHGAALAFVRSPALALSKVRFVRDLSADAEGIAGELVVPVPVLGEVDLPFRSALVHTPDGAQLVPQSLGERAWVEVAGTAQVTADGQMHFAFDFRAHLSLPEAEGWGGAAFEKMVQAAATRTLSRVGQALPAGMQAALDEQGTEAARR